MLFSHRFDEKLLGGTNPNLTFNVSQASVHHLWLSKALNGTGAVS